MPQEVDYEFGRIALGRGLLQQEQLEECIEILVALERVGSRKHLWDVIARKAYMDSSQIAEVRSALKEEKPTAESARAAGVSMLPEKEEEADESEIEWDVPLDAEVEQVDSELALHGIKPLKGVEPRRTKVFRPGDLKLTCTKGPIKGHSFALTAEKTVIGRDERVDIVIRGSSISRKHAEIVFGPEQVIIRDLGSRNGIAIDGVGVSEAVLSPGETIRIDKYRFVVEEI